VSGGVGRGGEASKACETHAEDGWKADSFSNANASVTARLNEVDFDSAGAGTTAKPEDNPRSVVRVSLADDTNAGVDADVSTTVTTITTSTRAVGVIVDSRARLDVRGRGRGRGTGSPRLRIRVRVRVNMHLQTPITSNAPAR
jgi:hypothetical protein